MEYILIEFTFGWNFQAYQEVSNGNVIRITDLEGNTLEYPSFPVESHVIDANPLKPTWAK